MAEAPEIPSLPASVLSSGSNIVERPSDLDVLATYDPFEFLFPLRIGLTKVL